MRKYILPWLLLLTWIPLFARPLPGPPTASPRDFAPRPTPFFSPQPTPVPTRTCLPQAAIRLSGYILDAVSGLGLAGAQIKITTHGDGRRFRALGSSESGERGYFTLAHMVCMQPLEFSMKITLSGYADLRLRLSSEGQSSGIYYLQPLASLTPVPTSSPTPTPSLPPAGKIVFKPAYNEVFLSSPAFITDLFLLDFSSPLAAYGLAIYYDPEIIEVDHSQGGIGVKSGSEGFIAAVNSYIPGTIIVSGFDVDGEVSRKSMHLATLFWKALAPGHTALDLEIASLADTEYQTIPAEARDGLVQVRKFLPGDVNGDFKLNFFDVLILAEYCLGSPPFNFILPAGDADGNGDLEWADVLFLAQLL